MKIMSEVMDNRGREVASTIYDVVLWINLMCLVTNLKLFYCLAHVHKVNRQRNDKGPFC